MPGLSSQWEADLKILKENVSDVTMFQVVKDIERNVHRTEDDTFQVHYNSLTYRRCN